MKFQITILLLIALFAIEANTLHCINKRVHIGRGAAHPRCPNGYAMQGLHRNRHDHLGGINYFRCCRLPARVNAHYTANWVHSFDRAGWSKCPQNYYMKGFQKSGGGVGILHLERGYCSKTTAPAGHCYTNKRVVGTLDRAGWSLCRNGYLMTGMWRNHNNRRDRNIHKLHRIEYFSCCRPRKTTCATRYHRRCSNRRVGYYTNVRHRVRRSRRSQRVVNRRQRYLQRTCYTRNVRQYFTKAQRYRRRVAYNAVINRRSRVRYRQRYTRYVTVRRRHYRNVRRTHTKRVRFRKRLPRYRRVAYWNYYYATCSKGYRVRRRRRVTTKKVVSCMKRSRIAKRVRYRKVYRVNSKRRVFTGRYAASGKPNCFKKVYKMVPYVRIVRRWAWRTVLVWGSRRSRCIRTSYKYVYYYTSHIRRYRCRRRRRLYRTHTSYYWRYFYKTVRYTRVHRVAYYRNHRVRRTAYRWAWRYVTRRTVVRRFRYVSAWRNVRASRVVPVSGTRNVWKYRTVPTVTYRTHYYYTYTVRRVRRYKNTRVCVRYGRRSCRHHY